MQPLWRTKCAKSLHLCPTLCGPMDWSQTVGPYAPLSMGFYRQGYWSGLACPPPGDLPDPGMEPMSLVSPALQVDYLPLLSPGKPQRTVWSFLKKKTKIELPFDPAIPLLGIHAQKNMVQKDTGIPIFIAVLFTVARTWKQPKCPLIRHWIKKMWYIYNECNGILLSH